MGETNQDKAFDGLIRDLQVFLELSFQEKETSINEWVEETVNKLETRCWEFKNCDQENCPAFHNECGRCWLIAGTMCGGMTQGKFVEKYGFCTECEFYRDVIQDDKPRKLRELVIALIHSLRMKQIELKESSSQVRILQGLLPICSYCKGIRDDKGFWNQLEMYISEHSEAQFSHGICPKCVKKFYPGLAVDDRHKPK